MPNMGGLFRRLLLAGRALTAASQPSRPRRERVRHPDLDALEERRLFYIPAERIVLQAVPSILTPPNKQYVAVTVSGTIEHSNVKQPRGFFYVTDQYGEIEPYGGVVLTPSPSTPKISLYSFTIHLRAQRGSQTMNGRQYNILVGAKDKDGTAGKTIAVLVPKDPNFKGHSTPKGAPARAAHPS
jgi:hypothetical protein